MERPPSGPGDLAPRLSTLAGKVGALLDIAKPRGVDFLDRVEEVLRERCGVAEILRERKRAFTKPATPDVLAALERRADFVVLALADCGRCNTCVEFGAQSREDRAARTLRTCGLSNCVDEASFFESRGVPTAVIATCDYARAAAVQRVELELPQTPMVTVRSSLQRATRDEVREFADEAMEAILEQLVQKDP